MIKRIFRRFKLIPVRFASRVVTGLRVAPNFEINSERKVESKVVWIIGNGPSVKIDDLEKIHGSGMLSAVANRFHMTYSKTSYRPDFVVSSDEDMIRDFGEEIAQNNAERSVIFAVDNCFKKYGQARLLLRLYSKIRLRISPIRGVYNAGGSLFTAIQVFYSMGYRDFILYGIDHNFQYNMVGGKAVGDGNHFIKNYRSGKEWIPPRTRQIEESFLRVKRQLESEGGSIVNASRYSLLPNIKRVDFDNIL